MTALPHLLDDHYPTRDRREAHLEHYREFVDSAHPEMGDGERNALRAHWIAQRYGIHFHTFDDVSYRSFSVTSARTLAPGSRSSSALRVPSWTSSSRSCALVASDPMRRGGWPTHRTRRRRCRRASCSPPHRSGKQAPDVAAEPTLPHYGRWWYPLYVRVAGFTPARLGDWRAGWWRLDRGAVSERTDSGSGRRERPGPNDGLESIHAGRRTAVYRVLHRDPAFELPQSRSRPAR